MESEKTPRDRAEDLISLLLGWRPTLQQSVWVIRLAVVLVVLVAIGHAYDITLLDWLKLLIVPAVIAGVGIWFNRQQRERELKIAERRAQDEALQAYLDKMTDLLVDKKLGVRPPEDNEGAELQKDPVRTVAWARTKTVLRRLDGRRKGAVVRFLREADLIKKGRPVIRSLAGADLREADLQEAVLEDTALEGVVLRGADLRGADLRGAVLNKADLTAARLHGANLSGAYLEGAEGITDDELERQSSSLEGATMPNGQKYEDWLKDQESGG